MPDTVWIITFSGDLSNEAIQSFERSCRISGCHVSPILISVCARELFATKDYQPSLDHLSHLTCHTTVNLVDLGGEGLESTIYTIISIRSTPFL